MTALLGWFLNTRMGQTILLALAICLAVYATYRVVDHRAFERGQADVQGKWEAAKAQARQQASVHNSAQADAGAKVAAAASQKASEVRSAISKDNTDTHEVITYVYQDRPVPVPADPRCVLLPVDDRVQRRIELGVDQARSAAR